jgi:hypothetical protein
MKYQMLGKWLLLIAEQDFVVVDIHRSIWRVTFHNKPAHRIGKSGRETMGGIEMSDSH